VNSVDFYLHDKSASRSFMSLSAVLFCLLELAWRALVISARLLRWLVSKYLETKKVQGMVFSNDS